MSWTLCTSGAAVVKAGANANSTITASGAALATFSDEAEGTINTITRRNWTTDFATATANLKQSVSDLCSDIIASKIIHYDMSGYTSRQEATTMLDVLRDNINRTLNELKLDEVKEEL